ncbi:MAG: ABC transporter permease subunit [Pseudomonadales bacterium]
MTDLSWSALRPGHRRSIACLLLLAVVLLLGPWLSPWGQDHIDYNAMDVPPSSMHWFGTDGSGRDLLVRTMAGGRVSLTIALLATLVSFAIGLPWGAIAGFAGGRVDQVMMRIVDGLYGLPFIFLVILLVVFFGRNPYLLFIAIGAVSWLDLARIVRGQTLVVKNAMYIQAAKALGVSNLWIITRHIVPNVMGPAFVYATLTIPGVIIAESFISFLGLGIQEPQTSWGVLIADGATRLHAPWQLIFPAMFLAMTLLALNVAGDQLRDAIDPQKQGVRL